MASFPPTPDPAVSRKEPCRLCGSRDALLLGRTDFWDIRSTDIVRCTGCGLMQLDPMLTGEETARGCLAYYVEESLRMPVHEQRRNLVRNFRRGVHFALGLRRRGINVDHMLELGPGSGYFAEGMRRVFPAMRTTVMDVVQEVLDLNLRDHGYAGIRSIPEEHRPALDGRFDLVIARDIIEHVMDIGAVLRNVAGYLKPGGHFHFITPNGHEDVWKHRLTHVIDGARSELLINHVNYFDGKGLQEHLHLRGMDPVEYYIYGLKPRLRGRGWSTERKAFAPHSTKCPATPFVEELVHQVRQANFKKSEVLPSWYLNGNLQLLGLMCAYQHGHVVRIAPRRNIGHEIHGLFRKRA